MTRVGLVAALFLSASCSSPRVTVSTNDAATSKELRVHPAETTLAELADAFERKDQKAAAAHLIDGWSGSRFWAEWSDRQWRDAAAALRAAQLKSAEDLERTYEIVDEGTPKTIHLLQNDGVWKLDYNSFKGPFPHGP